MGKRKELTIVFSLANLAKSFTSKRRTRNEQTSETNYGQLNFTNHFRYSAEFSQSY